jgi:hypothetical protein
VDGVYAQAVLLATAGLVAGVVNTLAGGGSLLTLPALIFSGLPADVANATNRVGVLLQSVVSVGAHHRSSHMPWRAAPFPLVVASVGATGGALLALALGREGLRPVIGVMLLVALPLVFVDPKRLHRDRALPRAVQGIGFLLAGLYGGFVQAGVGVLLLAVLSGLGGLSLVRANALKLLLVAVFTVPALALFVASDLVAWVPGLSLGVGSMLGGWVGAKLNVRGGDRLVRWVVVAVVAASGIRILAG